MKVRKIPQRTCLGCKGVKAKKELLRIVRTPEGDVVADPTGKKSGRGAYTCPNGECLEKSFHGAQLDRALEITITEQQKDRLRSDLTALLK